MTLTPSDEEIEIRLLLEAIYLKYGYDFRAYSKASIKRRLNLVLHEFGLKTITSLQEKVIHEAGAFSEILRYMTVSTTEMFRDPQFFSIFREKVVPILKTYPSLKFWIAGCSTGEEVYSYSVILEEEGLLRKTILYATDISQDALSKAEQGIYRTEQLKDFNKNYQKSGGKLSFLDYFTVYQGGALIRKDLKKNIVFSDHNLATDHVFSEVQFVSCRNVLIYFERELQDRAIGLFKDSLVNKGLLGIGHKETLRFSVHSSSFEIFNQEERIYRKRNE